MLLGAFLSSFAFDFHIAYTFFYRLPGNSYKSACCDSLKLYARIYIAILLYFRAEIWKGPFSAVIFPLSYMRFKLNLFG